MTRFWHRVGHLVIVALNLVAVYKGYVPPHYVPVAIAVQGLAHGILALVNHDPTNP